MIKIALIHNQPSPYRLPFFEEISKSHDLEVLFFQDPESKGRNWENKVAKKYTFKHRYFNSITINLFGKTIFFTPELYKKLLIEDFNIIIASDDFPSIFTLFFSFMIAKVKRSKYGIWTALYPNQHIISGKNILNIIYKLVLHSYRLFIYPFSDFILCYTKNATSLIRSINANTFQLVQAYPRELVQHTSVCRNIHNPNKNILYVGRLIRRKNIGFLIESFMKTSSKNWNLILIGDGPDKKRLQQLARDDNRIYFTGFLSGYKKYQYFQNAAVLVLVSDKDSWGLVVNEAMMFGLPVILSENVEAKEMVNGNGFVIRQNSEKQLIEAFHQILDFPENQRKMGNRSLNIIAKYTLREMVATFNEVISHVQ